MSIKQDALSDLLNIGLRKLVKDSAVKEDVLRFRGGNTPLFLNGNFVMDSNSHCPRLGLMRRHGLDLAPDTYSIISWDLGRAFEIFIKKVLDTAVKEGHHVEMFEEEDAQVTLNDDNGDVLFTMRPDLLIKFSEEQAAVIEMKSIQSANVANQVLDTSMPKLGAVLQWATASYFHGFKSGWTLYGLMWFASGYEFKLRKGFSFKPQLKTHFCEILEDNNVYVEGRKTIFSINDVLNGIQLLKKFYEQQLMPTQRPVQCDIYGNPVKYNLCQYCEWNQVCLQFDGAPSISLVDFAEIAEQELDINVKA